VQKHSNPKTHPSHQSGEKKSVSFRFSPKSLAKKWHNFQQGKDYHAAEYQPLSFSNISEQ